jgi:hypothetical protein
VHRKYRYALFHPGDGPKAERINDGILAAGDVCAVGAVRPPLAERCAGHIVWRSGMHSTTTIEVALTAELPPPGATLAAEQRTLNVLGAMGVAAARVEGAELGPGVRDRIQQIAADSAKPPWRPGMNMDINEVSECDALKTLVRYAGSAADARVATVYRWLRSGTISRRDGVVRRVRRNRAEQERVYDLVEVEAGGRLAVIELTSTLAVRVAYHHAPVVIAADPESRSDSSPAPRDVKICQTRPRYVDLAAVLEELNGIESGWHGHSTLIRSPKGRGTTIPLALLVELVERHML